MLAKGLDKTKRQRKTRQRKRQRNTKHKTKQRRKTKRRRKVMRGGSLMGNFFKMMAESYEKDDLEKLESQSGRTYVFCMRGSSRLVHF